MFEQRLENVHKQRGIDTDKSINTESKRGLYAHIALISFYILLFGLYMYGECRCIYKATQANWDPIDKCEIIYTVSAITQFGCIVGYFDIEDK